MDACEALRDARPATWLRPSHHGRPGSRLVMLVPMTAEEMAVTLGISVSRAREVRAHDPMYFCVQRCSISRN